MTIAYGLGKCLVSAGPEISIVMMGVVHVGHMRVLMVHWLMLMKMSVWLTHRIGGFMSMMMVYVVNMRMRMDERFVTMFVLMIFGQMQPYTDCH